VTVPPNAVEQNGMVEYRCQACGWWLFDTDARPGRIEIKCPNRRCPRRRQTIWLGGWQPRTTVADDAESPRLRKCAS
jgi:hypothetical protein